MAGSNSGASINPRTKPAQSARHRSDSVSRPSCHPGNRSNEVGRWRPMPCGQASQLKGCRSISVGYWLAKGMVQVTQAWSPCVAVVWPWPVVSSTRRASPGPKTCLEPSPRPISSCPDRMTTNWRRVPVGVATGRGFTEADGGGRLGALPIRRLVQVNGLNVGLAVIARVKSECSHPVPPFWSVRDTVRPRLKAVGPRPWR